MTSVLQDSFKSPRICMCRVCTTEVGHFSQAVLGIFENLLVYPLGVFLGFLGCSNWCACQLSVDDQAHHQVTSESKVLPARYRWQICAFKRVTYSSISERLGLCNQVILTTDWSLICSIFIGMVTPRQLFSSTLLFAHSKTVSAGATR